MFRVSSPRLMDVVVLSLSFLGSLAVVALSNWNGDWFVENGPFEMLQVGALFAACLLFARASGVLVGWPGRLALALSLASLLFLVRELPRCGSPFYVAGPCMPQDSKTYAYFLPLPLGLVLLYRNPHLRPSRLRLVEFASLPNFLKRTTPLIVVVLLIGVGQLADGQNLPVLEETAELSAYGMLALAGLAAAQQRDRQETERDDGLSPTAWSHA